MAMSYQMAFENGDKVEEFAGGLIPVANVIRVPKCIFGQTHNILIQPKFFGEQNYCIFCAPKRCYAQAYVFVLIIN